MAIINDLKVGILIDSKQLQEYDDDNEDVRVANTVMRYIEATTGQEFQISLKIPPTFRFTSV